MRATTVDFSVLILPISQGAVVQLFVLMLQDTITIIILTVFYFYIYKLRHGLFVALNIVWPWKGINGSIYSLVCSGVLLEAQQVKGRPHEKSFYDCTISEFGNGVEQDSILLIILNVYYKRVNITHMNNAYHYPSWW